MSEVGRTSTITGILDKSLDAGPLRPVNKLGVIKYYCPECYATTLYYREIEPGVFDISCTTCHKHWEKCKKHAEMQNKPLTRRF